MQGSGPLEGPAQTTDIYHDFVNSSHRRMFHIAAYYTQLKLTVPSEALFANLTLSAFAFAVRFEIEVVTGALLRHELPVIQGF
jgi:hypothetical protein